MPERDWTAARGKVDAEKRCRVCNRRDRRLHAAHVIGRKNDRPMTCPACSGRGTASNGAPAWASLGPPCVRCEGKGKLEVLFVAPDSIVPLCEVCHDRFDGRAYPRLDLLPHLTLAEQLRAVKDAGGIELARLRTCPTLRTIDGPLEEPQIG